MDPVDEVYVRKGLCPEEVSISTRISFRPFATNSPELTSCIIDDSSVFVIQGTREDTCLTVSRSCRTNAMAVALHHCYMP